MRIALTTCALAVHALLFGQLDSSSYVRVVVDSIPTLAKEIDHMDHHKQQVNMMLQVLKEEKKIAATWAVQYDPRTRSVIFFDPEKLPKTESK